MGTTNDATARARLELDGPTEFNAMVATCKHQVATIKQCADYPNQPGVQAAAKIVDDDAEELDKTLTALANARALVSTLETKRDGQVVVLRRDHDALETSVNVASKGQKEAILAWGGKVATRNPPPPSTDPPVNPTVKTTETLGTVVAQCKADKAAVCYLFQRGSDPGNPDAWPPHVIETKTRHVVAGLTIGQKVYFRIAVVRRGTGQGQWSGVMEITVR
jgi:hypothetical protein